MTDDYNENDIDEANGPMPQWMALLDELEREVDDQVSVYVPQIPKRKRKSRSKVRKHKRAQLGSSSGGHSG